MAGMGNKLIILFGLLGVGMWSGCGGAPGEREYQSGLREFERGRWVRARALLEKAIARRPGRAENAVAYHYLGVACWRMGQVQAALEAFEAGRRLAPEMAESLYNTGVIYFEGGDPARAEPLFQEAAAGRPADPRPLEFLGALYVQQGKSEEARHALSAALARAPQSARILNAMGCAEVRAGRSAEAIYYFMQALEKNARYAPALFNLGVLHRGRDEAQAQAYWRKYLEVVREDPPARTSPQARYAQQALDDVLVEHAPPPPPRPSVLIPAPRSYEELLLGAADEAKRGHPSTALQLCLEAAGRAERQGDGARQEKALREAVRLAPDRARAHYALGRFLAEREQTGEALDCFKKAIELDARFSMAQLGLAQVAVRAGEPDAALVACRAAVQQEPENPEALWLLASLYDQSLGLPEQAMRAYRDFERRFPGDPRVLRARARLKALQPAIDSTSTSRVASLALAREPTPPRLEPARPRLRFKPPATRNLQAAVQAYNRGKVYQQQGDLERALFFYLRAIENDDSFVAAFFNLGNVYAARREFDLAAEAYRLALEQQPDHVDARYNLALVLAQAGDPAGAVEHYRTILKTHPDHAASHYALGQLYAENPGAHALARRHYEAFLRYAPQDPAAAAVRDWLQTH